jgi:predicted transcriptional regulator
MVADPVTVDPDLTLSGFIEDVFFAHRHTAYPVAADGTAIGMVSFRHVLDVPRDEWDRFRVRDRMRALDQVLVVDADAAVGEVLSELMQGDLRRGLVRVDGRPQGLLSVTDVTRVLEVLSTSRQITTPAVAISRPWRGRSSALEPGPRHP